MDSASSGRRDHFLIYGLAASLVFMSLVCPISKSATYFPLFVSALLGLLLRLRSEAGLHFPRGIKRLAALWIAIALWEYVSVVVNGAGITTAPLARALDFLPVFLLAGLPLDMDWKKRVAAVSFFVLASTASAVVVLGAYQGATGMRYPFPVQLYSDGKLIGFFSHHIPAGGFFSTLVVMSACLLLYWKTSARLKLLLGVLLLLLFSGSLLSLSRTYFVSLCITLPLLFFKKNLKAAAIGTSFVALFFAVSIAALPSVKERISSITDLKHNTSNLERLYLWQVAKDMIAASPVAGIGYRQWGEKVSGYSARYSSEWKFSDAALHHAHNVYLHIAAETGLVGLSLFLSFWLSLAAILLRASAAGDGSDFIHAIRLGTAFAIINLLIGGFFENNFGTLLISLLLSCVVSLTLFVTDGSDAPACIASYVAGEGRS
jgi:O-antigen ligase